MALEVTPSFERGIYEDDERRPGLIERGIKGQWTVMEREIFNAVTAHCDRAGCRPLFSQRMQVVEAMLRTFDKEAFKPSAA